MTRLEESDLLMKMLSDAIEASKLVDEKTIGLSIMLILTDMSKSLAIVADSLNKDGGKK
jgi:hypothetical protein